MNDPEIERRLRAVMSHEAGRVDPNQVAERLSVDTLSEHVDVRPSGRRLTTPLLAAAGVAAVITGAVVIGTAGHDARSTPAAGASSEQSTPPAGSYTYVKVSDGVARDQIETWIPADRSQTWQLNQANFSDTKYAQQRAKCAAFPYLQKGGVSKVVNRKPTVIKKGHVPGCDDGDWGFLRPQFLDSLPDDPAAVLASMRKARSGGDAETFATGNDVLGTGWAQPATVNKIVAALKLLPGTTTSRNGDEETISYAGRIKPTVLEHWAVTVDQDGSRVVRTSFYYGDTAPTVNTITYRAVDRLGDR